MSDGENNTGDTTPDPAQGCGETDLNKPITKVTSRKTRRLWQARFLRYLAKCGKVARSARHAGVHPKYVHRCYHKYPRFARKWDEALRLWTHGLADSLEAEAIRRGRDGVDKPVYQGGKLVGTERRYSDALLIKALIAYRPERWATKDEKGDTTVNVGVQVNQELPEGRTISLTAADLEAARALMRQANPESEALPPADPQPGT